MLEIQLLFLMMPPSPFVFFRPFFIRASGGPAATPRDFEFYPQYGSFLKIFFKIAAPNRLTPPKPSPNPTSRTASFLLAASLVRSTSFYALNA